MSDRRYSLKTPDLLSRDYWNSRDSHSPQKNQPLEKNTVCPPRKPKERFIPKALKFAWSRFLSFGKSLGNVCFYVAAILFLFVLIQIPVISDLLRFCSDTYSFITYLIGFVFVLCLCSLPFRLLWFVFRSVRDKLKRK